MPDSTAPKKAHDAQTDRPPAHGSLLGILTELVLIAGALERAKGIEPS